MTQDQQRAAVVAEARSWIGTPYHPGADLKGIGVDCGMLLVRVFVDAGLVPPFDPRPYPATWHLHRSEERYLGFVAERARALGSVNEARAGDILLFRQGRCFSHGGIVTAWPFIVHAFAQHGQVEEMSYLGSPLEFEGRNRRPIKAFSLWDAES